MSALERHLEPKQERERVPDRRIRVRMNDVLQIRLHGDRLRYLGEITQLDRGFRSLRRRAEVLLLFPVARAVADGGDGDPDLVLRSGKEARGDEPRTGIGREAVYARVAGAELEEGRDPRPGRRARSRQQADDEQIAAARALRLHGLAARRRR